MASSEKTILVYENWSGPEPIRMGTLYVTAARGQEACSYAYDERWLEEHGGGFPMDPDLSFYRGRQYTPLDKRMFGLFADSCPDRWGRLLMNRREAIAARREERRPRRLAESDYLLGVYDAARMGALRFRMKEDSPFLSNDEAMATPPWIRLRELEHASREFENDESGLEEKWLRQLLAPGSSLGGARPKATVQDTDGTLWIAKFPSRHDEYNSGAWEKVAHDLARMCGLNVPESRLETFSEGGSTFLVQRFDRKGAARVHFSSAMTLLGQTDGSAFENGTGYLDLAAFLRSDGAEPKKDLEELWKRIVFNISISNTDDHLRNHGFLLSKTGWRLSPAYDMNPVPYGDTLTLNINGYDNRMDYELAAETAEYYGIRSRDASRMMETITTTVARNWRPLAEKYGLGRKAQEYMWPAFALAER